MTSRDFCFWLQGHLELRGEPTHELSASQVKIVQNHLNLVFKHEIDPSMPDETGELQVAHDGKRAFPFVVGTGPGGTTYRC